MNNAELDTKKKGLIFDLGRSIRYNNKRRAFFEKWDKICNLLSVVLGSSTVYSLTQHNQKLATTLSLALTIISALALFIGFGAKARDCLDYARQFNQLKERLLRETLSESLIIDITTKMNDIDTQEGTPLLALEQICYNEEIYAEGLNSTYSVKIKWYQRLFSQYFTLNPNFILKQISEK